MKNKKSGFTVIELVLALAITVMILGSVLTIFISSTNIFTNVDVKSDLQKEAQNAEKIINNVGMQASRIKSITLVDKETLAESEISDFGADDEKNYSELTNLFTDVHGDELNGTVNNDEKYLNVNEITIITREEVQGTDPTAAKTIGDVYYTIKYEPAPNSDKTKPRGNLTVEKNGVYTKIGEDVESITIKPSTFSSKLSQANSIEFNVNFAKKKGFSDVKYSVPINIAFRNKIIY